MVADYGLFTGCARWTVLCLFGYRTLSFVVLCSRSTLHAHASLSTCFRIGGADESLWDVRDLRCLLLYYDRYHFFPLLSDCLLGYLVWF